MTPAPRTCKVIATSLQGHAKHAALDLLKLVYDLERETDPGAPCDTVIVNSGSGWKRATGYLGSIDGTRTSTGTLTVLRTESGGTCAAFNAAYEAFRGDYAYWLFTEDHEVVNAPGYLSRLIDLFGERPRTGFVALNGLTDAAPRYARGAIGFTHDTVLDAVYQAWGSLPHPDPHESFSAEESTFLGEALFTNLISRMGYQLIDANDLRLTPDRADCRQLVARLRQRRATLPLVQHYLDRVAVALEDWSEQF